MNIKSISLSLLLAGFATTHANASTVYTLVNFTAALGLSATGTITTDGNVGSLLRSDIQAFDLTISDSSGNSVELTNLNTVIIGTGLSATSTELLYNFDTGAGGTFNFGSFRAA